MYEPAVITPLAEKPGHSACVFVCAMCGEKVMVVVPTKGLQAWADGAKVQEAFPWVPREERELFISGTCKDCWDKTFE